MTLDAFFDSDESVDIGPYGDIVCLETRRRIRVSLAAYTYEVMLHSIMSDHEYDELAKSIDLSIDTRRPDLDKWFRKYYKAYTGSWIHSHPEKTRLDQICRRMLGDK
jgi:hypothetical protein